MNLQMVVRQRRHGCGRAVGNRQHLGPRVAKVLRHFGRATGVAADAEDQQHIVGLHPQQLVGGVHGASAQFLHAGAAHVQVQGQP